MKHVGQKIRNSLVLTGLICLSPSLGLAESLACSSAFRALEQTLPPASQVLDAQSLAKANQGRDTLIDFVRQIGLKDLEKGFEVILESGIAPDQATGNLDVTFKVQFTNKKGTPDELRFLGAYSKQTDGWTFSHLPTATPTDRDYFIGLRMGILKGEFEYRSAAALIEMQTLLPKLKSRAGDLRSLADVEALHRLSLALKNNSLDVRRVGRILQVFERFKASLSDPTLRRHPLTEESIAHVLQSKGLFSEKGEKLADPSPDSIGRFLKGEFGDRVYMNDGLGVAFELQRKGSGVGVKINFLTNRSATDDAIKKWADEVYSLKPIEIQRQLIDGFRRLAIVEITTHLAASETQVRLVESLVSDITSGGFSFDKNGLGMITKSEIAYDLADAVTLIQKLASNSLMQSGRDSETLSLDERIQLVQSGHDAYLAAQREKYPTSPHLGRMQLVSQQLKKFILAVFPSTPPEQIVELDARIKREFDDFLKSIEI